MARKPTEIVGLHLRFSEGLRRRLEREAARHGHSMNAEIVERLEQSFDVPDQATAIAEKLKEMIKTEREIWNYAVKNTEEGSK